VSTEILIAVRNNERPKVSGVAAIPIVATTALTLSLIAALRSLGLSAASSLKASARAALISVSSSSSDAPYSVRHHPDYR
jgi:hypothetical protein